MALPIQPINLASSPISSTATTSTAKTASDSFQNMLSNAINSVSQSEVDANKQVDQLVNGNAQDLSNVTIAMEKSDLMLKLAVNVRDKVVSAYQEVMRMQI